MGLRWRVVTVLLGRCHLVAMARPRRAGATDDNDEREVPEDHASSPVVASGSRRRKDGPLRAMRYEAAKSRSKIASPRVGSAMAPCQVSIGS